MYFILISADVFVNHSSTQDGWNIWLIYFLFLCSEQNLFKLMGASLHSKTFTARNPSQDVAIRLHQGREI